jgi:beta-glucan synthesis-associated protein KRE6
LNISLTTGVNSLRQGNLGRAGYGATTEGLWPYSYDTCDLGTFPNQTDHNGNPASAATGNYFHDGPISYLPGQRLSACTCPGGDHPGPDVTFGRAAPEIDMIEAQINLPTGRGQASQSFQLAPFDYGYNFNNETPATTIYDTTNTVPNVYKGGVWQQALSSLTFLDATDYTKTQGGFGIYGFEYNPSRGDDGYITWAVNGQKSWTVTTASIAPDPVSQIAARLIPEEPMVCLLFFIFIFHGKS